ncbi:winged helix-turn-helix domain-containing protein [Celeribacter ethanolicus]|uniref:winged helix-turn-helix domain-containing protein n=1 Tax=Celeribacter ethanolicus TaxID=1758178 RepID=UPI0008367C56|nr:LysR family transcriptional regulator [Celeribacter ethanolicus]
MSEELDDETRLRLRIYFGARLMLGPGKADLLDGIRDTGSIAAAGRAMAMSYKRAWSLVEEMNAAFKEPLVASARGGSKGGGAHLTETGEAVLTQYRAILAEVEAASEARIAMIRGMLAERDDMRIDMSEGK